MNFVESFNFFGAVDAKQIPCIKDEGAPTTATEGAVGCFYMDTLTGEVYKCTAVDGGVYTWANVCGVEALRKDLGLNMLPGKNLFNKDTMSELGSMVNQTNGQVISNRYTTKARYSDYIPVEGGETYVWFGGNISSSLPENASYLYTYAVFDENKSYVSGALVATFRPFHTITIPENGAFLIINVNDNNDLEVAQLEKGTEPTEYEPYGECICSLDNLVIKESQILRETQTTTTRLLHLPEKYDLVVGDTFELFYKGVMLCKDPYAYNILAKCSIGKAWGRKFEVTPTAAGSYNLTITVTDDYGNVLDTGSTTLVVETPMVSPTELINVLCVGDSLTQGGTWTAEACRRLTKTSSTTRDGKNGPTGLGLSNIAFVGKNPDNAGGGFEAFGGWKFSNYLSTATSTSNYWVTVSSHSKTDNDQQGIYQDVNGVQWQLETIESKRLKFKKYSGSGVLPSAGTLIWVSGGVDTSNIVYTSSSLESGNPFVYNGAIDFAAYCADIGISTIHQCYILLGWNNAATSEADYKSDAKAFIDLLLAFNPSMKIVLMGLQIPSLDGCANNYGANGVYANYRALQEYVFNLNKWYSDIADEYPNNVSFINIAGQFDIENNALTMSAPVNTRNPNAVTVQSNGVHPAKEGYYQIADAVFRKFNNDNN